MLDFGIIFLKAIVMVSGRSVAPILIFKPSLKFLKRRKASPKPFSPGTG